MTGRSTYRSNPCRKCDKKICYENCDVKTAWIEGRKNGVFALPNNMINSTKEVVYRRG